MRERERLHKQRFEFGLILVRIEPLKWGQVSYDMIQKKHVLILMDSISITIL